MTNTPKLITNYEVLNNVKFPSDHRLLRTTVLLTLPKKSRKTFKSQPRIPKTENEIKQYTDCLKSHIEDKSPEITCVQTYYDILEEAITHSLTKKSDTNKKKGHKIFSEETLTLIKERTDLVHKHNKDKDAKKKLSKLYKETSKSIKKDYSKHRQNIITTNLNKFRSTKRAFKELNLSKTWIQKLKNKSKETKTRRDIMDQATAFYQELYKRRGEQSKLDEETYHNIPTKSGRSIDEKEVYEHIKQLKSERSPGPDGITNEALKLGAPILVRHLTHLFNMILDTETVPKQWCTSDIILLYKKGNPLDIGNYRPISLLASVYKLFASIILKHITNEIDKAQPIEQAGFRSGFSTTDHIQALEQVIEKYKEYNKPLYLAFIDYSKAFDSISHSSIWNALKSINIDQKYINIIKNIYTNSTSKVKLEARGEEIRIERGVRQGDPISPKLFIAVLENIFNNVNWHNKGIKINDSYLNHLRFADDIVILAETSNELEQMICSLDQESTKIGLEMNATKTKILTNSSKTPITARGNKIEYVDNYIYLGKQVSFSKLCNEEEIERRINITWKKFWSLKEILKGDYSINMKKIVFDTCLLPCLLYGCQTWVFTTKAKQRIQTTQRAMERSTLKIRKIHKIKSKVIRQKTKVTDALIQALKLKWQWAGHIARYTDNRWTIQTTRWKGPVGKRKAGRPKRRWADDITDRAGKDWMTLGSDRKTWKEMEEAFTQRGVHIPNVNNITNHTNN